ncbi:hypothetical protein K466DRAFT_601028 [Polyporus arcularius HHB13444]|uniref:BTB domain-containing protein n=1 Tax=Polyporus arcularius HHB13444 TaxID=1314778 RepID=A0A5C3P7V2_9APHY|nr:hypothetical protein K466DRAFT_601028 [Polyporus arcularius HHB13444]
MSEHTRKRARLDSEELDGNVAAWRQMAGEEIASVVEHKRDDEFWYEDGNIILVAGDTGFCVFKGILSDHSPVFRDMFSLPQPPNLASSSAAERCPVVSLTDSPNELRHLLRACIPKNVEDRFLPPEPTYDEIASLIRLGHKYQIQQLVDSSIAYLRRYYPHDFDAWDKLGQHKRPPNFRSLNTIGVVSLARLTGCMDLLPAALLAICFFRKDCAFSSVPSAAPGGPIEKLSMDDIQLCFYARVELAAVGVEMGLRICYPVVANTCAQPRTCKAALIDLISTQHENGHALCALNPFRPYSACYQSARATICRSCYAMLEERDRSERRAMWKKLPELLGIVVNGWAPDDNAGAAAPQAAI